MIFVPYSCGQMCNKLTFFTRVLATAPDRRENVCHFVARDILSFTDTHPESIPQIKVSLFNHDTTKIARFLANLKGRFLPMFQPLIGSRWLPHFIGDWRFVNREGVVRHRDEICAYLAPKSAFSLRAQDLIARLRSADSLVAGVHIRRGDYRGFMEGRYFYTDGQYAEFLSCFAKGQKRPVRFVLVSNDQIDLAPYRTCGLDITIATATPQEDVVMLSKCDIILGPPSTFSGFASYLGGIPRIELRGLNDCVLLNCFGRVKDGSAPLNALWQEGSSCA